MEFLIYLNIKFQRSPPKYYIVDLMHEPGKLMDMNALDAIQYTKL